MDHRNLKRAYHVAMLSAWALASAALGQGYGTIGYRSNYEGLVPWQWASAGQGDNYQYIFTLQLQDAGDLTDGEWIVRQSLDNGTTKFGNIVIENGEVTSPPRVYWMPQGNYMTAILAQDRFGAIGNPITKLVFGELETPNVYRPFNEGETVHLSKLNGSETVAVSVQHSGDTTDELVAYTRPESTWSQETVTLNWTITLGEPPPEPCEHHYTLSVYLPAGRTGSIVAHNDAGDYQETDTVGTLTGGAARTETYTYSYDPGAQGQTGLGRLRWMLMDDNGNLHQLGEEWTNSDKECESTTTTHAVAPASNDPEPETPDLDDTDDIENQAPKPADAPDAPTEGGNHTFAPGGDTYNHYVSTGAGVPNPATPPANYDPTGGGQDGLTQDDVYQANRKALEEQLGNFQQPSLGGVTVTSEGLTGQSEVEAAQEAQDEALELHNENLNKGLSFLKSIKPLDMPSGVGDVDNITGTVPILGTVAFSFTPYETWITRLRYLQLWAILVIAYFVMQKIIRAAIA